VTSETRSGLVIPDTVKEKPQQGEVITISDYQILESGARPEIALRRNSFKEMKAHG
jgi:co-chaperonin GroES (HSP10)